MTFGARDLTGRRIESGQILCRSHSLGRSHGLDFAVVLDVHEHVRNSRAWLHEDITYKLDVKSVRRRWHEGWEIIKSGVVQYPNRSFILTPDAIDLIPPKAKALIDQLLVEAEQVQEEKRAKQAEEDAEEEQA